MQNQSPVAVLGGGSFGTVLANLMAEKGLEVRLWLRNQQAADEIDRQHRNSHYLPVWSWPTGCGPAPTCTGR